MTMPAQKQPWLQHQCDLLERLLEAGASFQTVCERVGHPIFSCRTKASELRAMRRKAAGQPKIDKPRKAPKIALAAPIVMQAPPSAASPRSMSTSKLVLDAELRSRISEQGITAALLGDPRPGRSALDAKKASA